VNRVFHTSMEIGVRVMVEDLLTGVQQHTSSAYLTFVSLDKEGKPMPIPPVIPETPDEIRRYEQAGERRDYRLALRNRNKNR
jgi:acyl-CoA hydrolase